MNQWAFVLAAYGIVIGATLVLIAQSFVAMRRAETDANALRDRS